MILFNIRKIKKAENSVLRFLTIMLLFDYSAATASACVSSAACAE